MEYFSDHVSICPHLLEASYSCPSCGKVEHLGVEELQDGSIATNHADKRSKLKRAGDFLKHFRCPDCRNLLKRLHRRPVGAFELESLPPYPHGRAEMDSNHDKALHLRSSVVMKKPYCPESPHNIDYHEIGSSGGRHFGVSSPTVSKSVRNVRRPDENGWDSQSPTIQEVEDSNSKHLGVPDPGTVGGRPTTSSRCRVKSQRKSKIALRLSTPDRPLENGPADWSHERTRDSNARMSKSSINHLNQSGSTLVEQRGSPLPSNSRFPITASHGPPDDGVVSPLSQKSCPPDDGMVSPLSPKSLHSGDQIQQGFASAMAPLTSFWLGNAQDFGADQNVAAAFQRFDNGIGTGNIAEQRILETVSKSTSKYPSTLAKDTEISVPPEDDVIYGAYRKQLQKNEKLSTCQVRPETPITRTFDDPLREASLIGRVDIQRELVDHLGHQTLEALVSSTRAQVKHLHQLLHESKDQWEGYSNNLAGLNTSSLLNDGLEALAQYFSGNWPTTFKGVFALVQFADACARTYHHPKTLLTRSSFHQNALRWGEKISDWQDRCRFSEITNILWRPLRPTNESHYADHKSDLRSALRSGAVINSCTCFLDGKVKFAKNSCKC